MTQLLNKISSTTSGTLGAKELWPFLITYIESELIDKARFCLEIPVSWGIVEFQTMSTPRQSALLEPTGTVSDVPVTLSNSSNPASDMAVKNSLSGTTCHHAVATHNACNREFHEPYPANSHITFWVLRYRLPLGWAWSAGGAVEGEKQKQDGIISLVSDCIKSEPATFS